MPVTSVEKDPENLTMTIVADFPVPISRLWDAYADPRQIEKFWGPPTYPATFTRHDLYPGGRSEYYMTGPEGDRSAGYWEYLAVEKGHSFEVLDGFAGEDGQPNEQMPSMRMVFTFEETAEGSRLTTITYFNSAEELEQLLEMGMEEGTRAAMAQIDDVLTDLRSFAADRATEAQLLSDTQVRVSRVIRGTPQQVWDAHHAPELLQRWLLGPDGWQFTNCQVATEAGQTYRYAWADANGENGFALTGEVRESQPPHREVTTEAMEGIDGPPTLNEQTLTPVEGGTLLSLVITYDSKELRDTVLATGMTEGMEISYSRLEKVLAA
ncbi:SRPBCC family protein [Nesterenkonia flava]|uniref:SRPBCC family protein n=1 Tax=Nesterenkonia flava TaxID=469799 RepID=A0ABU1FS46_9MICC|nr:SRPBCC family protein [Nesterenkonia flava]MDR5711489.1 SRPBCC family protein [Nesterenkonia flava]